MSNLLEVKNLEVSFHTYAGEVKAVRGVSFEAKAGECLAIVGESGSGKTVTSKAVLGLIATPPGDVKKTSEIIFDGQNIMNYSEKEWRAYRGKDAAMIFQDPMTSLNPTMKVGKQIMESILLHSKVSKDEAKKRALELLKMVNIPNPEERMNQYPYEFSGGMRQRVVIAIALACNPKLMIADEPTTALDVTIQAQILDLLRNLKDKINSSIMLITHDLGVIAEMADYVVVMYAGRVVEKGTAEEIFANPAHPYTIGLMASKPVVGKKVDKLYSIPGKVPNPINMPDYCYFKDRCEMQVEKCSGEYPHMIQLSPTHMVSCYRYFDGKVGE